MVLGALKALEASRTAEAAKTSTGKYGYLDVAMQHWIEGWESGYGYTDVLRCSGIYDLCPREFVLNYWRPLPGRSFKWISQVRMSVGTHLHLYLQDYVLGPMGILHGTWVDLSVVPEGEGGGTKTEGFHPDPERAQYEIQHQLPLTWRYVEKTVWDESLRIKGHLDGELGLQRVQWINENKELFAAQPAVAAKEMWKIPCEDMALLEIKSTGKVIYDKMVITEKLPPYYAQQATVYQKLSGIDTTVFWYMERGDLVSHCFAYEGEEAWWNEARRKAKLVWRALKNNTLPDSMKACAKPTLWRAKHCAHAKECWDPEFDFEAWRLEQVAKQPERKWLDLSDWVEPE